MAPGAILIDATRPLDQVVNAILSRTLASSPTSRASKASPYPGQPRHTLETGKPVRPRLEPPG